MAVLVPCLAALLTAQLLLAARVGVRLLRTARGRQIHRSDAPQPARVSIIVPVLNERGRLGACLDSLLLQPCEVIEILVVDGGSTDGTTDLAARYARRDPRLRIVDASPVPADWTGKTWGLHCGLRASAQAAEVVLCVDADVRAAPALTRSLLAHLAASDVAALSVATRQRLLSRPEGVLHPSMLATLVYRFGIPGSATTNPSQVQANGQCFLARRDLLLESGALVAARASLCEDITVARCLAAAGHRVGFYESDDLAEAAMYVGWRDTWRNWPRSLPMRDQYFGWRGGLGLAEVVLVQALPLPTLLLALLAGAPVWISGPLAGLAALRLGVLAGVARAYVARPWTYWLSPLADVAVALTLMRSALRRRHTWRGRAYERTAPGRFHLSTAPAQARFARLTGTGAGSTAHLTGAGAGPITQRSR
jgi:dolichol-phosphate mannosyltransferase